MLRKVSDGYEATKGSRFQHYEVSNYAKEGFECSHNRLYWDNKPFLAFGMGAASRPFTRPRSLSKYFAFVESLRNGGETAWTNLTSPDMPASSLDEVTDRVMLSLRLPEGLDLSQMRVDHGETVVGSIVKGTLSPSPPSLPIHPPSLWRNDFASLSTYPPIA